MSLTKAEGLSTDRFVNVLISVNGKNSLQEILINKFTVSRNTVTEKKHKLFFISMS